VGVREDVDQISSTISNQESWSRKKGITEVAIAATVPALLLSTVPPVGLTIGISTSIASLWAAKSEFKEVSTSKGLEYCLESHYPFRFLQDAISALNQLQVIFQQMSDWVERRQVEVDGIITNCKNTIDNIKYFSETSRQQLLSLRWTIDIPLPPEFAEAVETNSKLYRDNLARMQERLNQLKQGMNSLQVGLTPN